MIEAYIIFACWFRTFVSREFFFLWLCFIQCHKNYIKAHHQTLIPEDEDEALNVNALEAMEALYDDLTGKSDIDGQIDENLKHQRREELMEKLKDQYSQWVPKEEDRLVKEINQNVVESFKEMLTSMYRVLRAIKEDNEAEEGDRSPQDDISSTNCGQNS
jgi:hypothetical protein